MIDDTRIKRAVDPQNHQSAISSNSMIGVKTKIYIYNNNKHLLAF